MMSNFIKKNINKDHIFTALNQFSKSGYGLLTLILVPLFFTQEEQGYWFAFMSLSALVLLADSGFSNIILLFVAHEFAFLRFDDKRQVVGNDIHLKRLSTFYIFCVKWASSVVLFAFPGILAAGYYLLSQKTTNIQWLIPWVIYMIGSAIMFLNSTMLYFFEGCDSVGTVQKIRVEISLIMSLVMCIGIISRLSLFALSFSLLLSSTAGIFLILNKFRRAISGFMAISKTYSYSWKKEFMSLLWKYAISWTSGYFIFQMYTPFVFHFYGPVEAGKVGISMTLWMGVFSISNVWVYAITPKLNILVSKKDWKALDKLFFKNLILAGITFLTGIAVVFSLLILLKGKVAIIDRFVDNTSMSLLAAAWFLQIIVNTLAVYLRAHKEEPLVIPSSVSAVYIVITTFLCAKFLPPEYFFLGFLSSYLWGMPWILNIFHRKRKTSHIDEYPTVQVTYNSNTNI